MEQPRISINQIASFSKYSPSATKNMAKSRLERNTHGFAPYYALAKSRIVKSLQNGGDLAPVVNGISILKKRKATSSWHVTNNKCSIEAMELFTKFTIPPVFLNGQLKAVRAENTQLELYGVNITVSPDWIFEIEIGGVVNIGGIKLHTTKSGAFENYESGLSATLVHKYLSKHVCNPQQFANPQLCFCVDVFAATPFVTADVNTNAMTIALRKACKEYIEVWDEVKMELSLKAS